MTAERAAQSAMVHGPGCKRADVIVSCRCGANVSCRTCGWGRGQSPCACSPTIRPIPSILTRTLLP